MTRARSCGELREDGSSGSPEDRAATGELIVGLSLDLMEKWGVSWALQRGLREFSEERKRSS